MSTLVRDRYPVHLYKNAGSFSQRELESLSCARVAVGGLGAFGMGAVGLAQLGVGAGPGGVLKIADPDVFEDHNGNRQAEAVRSSLGRNKTEVVAERIRGLVPQVQLREFTEGITLGNLDEFLDGVDLVVDAVDFLRPDVKFALHRRARELGIPVVAGLLVREGAVGYLFEPDGLTFEDFFGFPQDPELRKSWVLPTSRILGANSSFTRRQDVVRHTFEVLTGQTHITSNSIAASAAHMLLNHLVVSRLLGRTVPAAPKMVVVDPESFSLEVVDLEAY